MLAWCSIATISCVVLLLSLSPPASNKQTLERRRRRTHRDFFPLLPFLPLASFCVFFFAPPPTLLLHTPKGKHRLFWSAGGCVCKKADPSSSFSLPILLLFLLILLLRLLEIYIFLWESWVALRCTYSEEQSREEGPAGNSFFLSLSIENDTHRDGKEGLRVGAEKEVEKNRSLHGKRTRMVMVSKFKKKGLWSLVPYFRSHCPFKKH